MNEDISAKPVRKGDPELARVMRKFIFWGSLKLIVLSAISAVVVYFYLY
jgi:hypothetical protein